MAELIQIPKPDLGRPNDSRLTQDYIDARPELAGVRPFVEGEDVDLVDELNDRLGTLHALVAYASPELGERLEETIPKAERLLEQLGAVGTQISGVRLGESVDAPLGGTLLTLEPAPASARVSATVQPAAYGGTLFVLGGTDA